VYCGYNYNPQPKNWGWAVPIVIGIAILILLAIQNASTSAPTSASNSVLVNENIKQSPQPVNITYELLNTYCKEKHGNTAKVVMENRWDAYSWHCLINNQSLGNLSMDDVCRKYYPSTPYAVMEDRWDAASWYCTSDVTLTINTKVSSCIDALQITSGYEGRELLVCGIVYEQKYLPYNQSSRLYFSENKEFFFVCADCYFTGVEPGMCVSAKGDVELSYDKIPFINVKGELLSCP
jgi:hypothetical protein